MKILAKFLQPLSILALALTGNLAFADTLTPGGPYGAVDSSTNSIFTLQPPPSGPGMRVFRIGSGQTQEVAFDSAASVAVDPIAGKAYVTDPANSSLWIVDTSTLEKSPVAIAANPGILAVNAATHRVYVVHFGGNSVSVVDGITKEVTAVPVGSGPATNSLDPAGAIAVNPATNRIYLANQAGQSLSVIDGAANTSVEVPLGAFLGGVAVDPVLGKVYVAAGTTLIVLDGNTLARTDVALPDSIFNLVVDPLDHKIYGVLNNVLVIDGVTLEVSPPLAAAEYVNVLPDTRKAYSAYPTCGRQVCPTNQNISVIDGDSDSVVQTFYGEGGGPIAVNPVTHKLYSTYRIAGSGGFNFAVSSTINSIRQEQVANMPVGVVQPVAVNPVSNRVYAGNGSQILVFDGESEAALPSIPVPAGAMFAVNPATNKIYVANSGIADSVTVIDGATQATTSVATGRQPDVVAVNPLTNRIYTTSIPDKTVTAIDGDTLVAVTIPVGDYPERIAVDAARNLIYVTNRLSGTVSVIDGSTNVATPLPVGAAPAWAAVDPASGKVFVPLYGEDKVAIFAPPSNTVTKVAVGAGPSEVAIDPARGMAYVVNLTAHSLTTINVATNAVVETLTLPAEALSVLVDPATGKVYVGSASVGASNNVLTVFEGLSRFSNTYTRHTVTVNAGYHNLALNPVTRRIYVGSQGGGGLAVVSDPRPVGGPVTTISPLPGNKTASFTPSFTFSAGAGIAGDSPKAMFYQVDGYTGSWTRASGSGPFSGALPQLAPGMHVLYAYAADAHAARPDGPTVGPIAAYAFMVTAECLFSSCADLAIAQEAIPPSAQTKKDIVMKLTASNPGSTQATNVVLTNPLPSGAQFIWAQLPCSHSGGVVTCPIGAMDAGTNRVLYHAYRMPGAGTITNNASVAGTELDPQPANNAAAVDIPVTASPAGVLTFRYRLYSDVTKEHHFTTDLNEYNVLGASGGWVQEGTVGKVLDNPGSFGGVEATPYYRLYDPSTSWHHWTTDPNEYFTLALAGWNAEGVDGYILPTQAPGTTQLYRLNYPALGSLHHWTIDANEYNTLVTQYGWVGEGGSGFVVQ